MAWDAVGSGMSRICEPAPFGSSGIPRRLKTAMIARAKHAGFVRVSSPLAYFLLRQCAGANNPASGNARLTGSRLGYNVKSASNSKAPQ
jgi:hypothetical protein